MMPRGLRLARLPIRLQQARYKHINFQSNRRIRKISLEKLGDQERFCKQIEDAALKEIDSATASDPLATVVLCTSGGSDSISLLHIMQSIKTNFRPGLDLHVLNFNHKMRAESDEEAVFVKSWADQYALPFHLCELPETQRFVSAGFQERTRDWRRAAALDIASSVSSASAAAPAPTVSVSASVLASVLASVVSSASASAPNTNLGAVEAAAAEAEVEARASESVEAEVEVGAASADTVRAFVALAHTHDDQQETVLLKLLRGVHVANFHGMKKVDGPFLRPLLGFTKSQLQQYLTCRDLPWREDASNQSREYKRNAVRLDLLPLMAELSGGGEALNNRLEHLVSQSEDMREWLDVEVKRWRSELKYTTAPGTIAPFSLTITPDQKSQIAKPVLSDLLREWVFNCTGTSPGFDAIDLVTRLVLTNGAVTLHGAEKGKIRGMVTIARGWDVERLGCEVRLRRRENMLSPSRKNRDVKITQYRGSIQAHVPGIKGVGGEGGGGGGGDRGVRGAGGGARGKTSPLQVTIKHSGSIRVRIGQGAEGAGAGTQARAGSEGSDGRIVKSVGMGDVGALGAATYDLVLHPEAEFHIQKDAVRLDLELRAPLKKDEIWPEGLTHPIYMQKFLALRGVTDVRDRQKALVLSRRIETQKGPEDHVVGVLVPGTGAVWVSQLYKSGGGAESRLLISIERNQL